MSPTLTISIPTYNRANLIGETLDSILLQINDSTRARIEVLVSDNCSTDNLPGLIADYQKRYPGIITYVRNAENIDFSPNVNASVCKARGDFVLIMSDDDCLESSAIEDVLKVLDGHPDLGVGFLHFRTWSKTLSEPVDKLSTHPDRFYPDGTKYIVERHGSFSPALISGILVRKTAWIEAGPERYTDINSIHFIMAPLIMAKYPCYDFSSKDYVRYRVNMGHWSIRTDPTYPFPMYVSYLKGCRAVKPLYPKSVYTMLYCRTIRTTIGHMIRNKVLNLPFPKADILNMLAPYLDYAALRPCLMTILMKFTARLPRWTLYMPFRWLVPKSL